MAPPARKRTMVKHVTGKVRPVTYDIPADGHVYGKALEWDEVDGSVTLTDWDVHSASAPAADQFSYVMSNRAAFDAGAKTAADYRTYALQHPDLKSKNLEGSYMVRNTILTKQQKTSQVFGVPSDKVRSAMRSERRSPSRAITTHAPSLLSAPFPQSHGTKELIECKYMGREEVEPEYPSLAGLKKQGKAPVPHSTIASRSHHKTPAAPPKPNFCMKRFQNVPGRLSRAAMGKE